MPADVVLTLVVIEGPEAGRRIPITAARTVFGRAKTCDVVLADSTVSRQHVVVEREGDAFILADVGSANGTFVEGVKSRITRHALRDGDEITLGRTRLRAEVPAAAAAAAGAAADATVLVSAAPAAAPSAPAPVARGVGVQQPSDLPIVLTVLAGPDRGMVYSPSKDVITIGRLTTADVPLNDPAVSRLHATIKRQAAGYTLYDENSRNGIEVGTPPHRVASAELKHGETIRLGESEIRVDIGIGKGGAAEESDATVLTGTVGDRTFTMSLHGLGTRTRARAAAGADDDTASLRRVTGPRICLQVVSGPDKGTMLEPPAGTTRFTVGRGDRATYRLSDPGVSSVHFSVSESGGAFTLKDESSRNGTFLGTGTERITTLPLKGGEELHVGASVLKVEILGAGVETSAPVEDHTMVMAAPAATAAPAAAPTAATPPAPAAAKPAAPAKPPGKKKKPEELVPELARSAAAKERISKIMKGVSLRPIRRPGTPRQWAALGLTLLAVLVSYGFGFGNRILLSAGPVFEGHADIEDRCETCHVGGTPLLGAHTQMNGSCVTADCHAKVLKNKPDVRDDCISCHTEHRGRTFPIKGGEELCWSCHLQDYQTRLMQAVVATDPAQQARFAERVQRVEVGLKFSHQAHDKETAGDVRYDTCVGCHPAVEAGRTFALPGHAECLDCHAEAVSADTKVAQAKKGPDCLKCHTREDGEMTEPPARGFAYVVFSHQDHKDDACKACHAPIWQEGPYHSVTRTDLYPVAMDACYTCHQQRQATVKCLDCHREHHSFPAPEEALAGATGGGRGFDRFLALMLALALGMIGYTYADMRLAKRWLEPPPPPPAATPAAKGGPSGAPAAAPAAVEAEVMPFPKVDIEACISCSSCYNSCPKDVLKGDEHGKSTVVNPNSCIALEGCRICEQGCPTGAIRVTTAPLLRTVERPEVDEHNEAKLGGLFFVGEVIGAALIKSAINQGHQAVSYIADKKPKVAEAAYDVIVVGAGPGGLGAALEAKRRGLRYLCLERDTIASTIKNYPRDKAVLAEPVKVPLYGMLPMMDAEKDTLIEVWTTIVRKTGLEVREHEEVVDIKRTGTFLTVKSNKGEYQGAYVVLAIGTRGNPRRLGVPGEEGTRVAYNLIDAADHKGKQVLVVGGGDSAIEAAVALGRQPGTKCALSYRKAEFGRVKKRNLEQLDEVVKGGGVELLLGSTVKEIRAQGAVLTCPSGERELACVEIFALIGADPPRAWIEKLGVPFVTREEEVVAW